MKAVFRLNEEKLDFNHKVLSEREKVNTSTIQSLKRKSRHYREVLKTVQLRYETLTVDKAKENKFLTKEYKKYTRDFLDLQKKLERFEKADKLRFNEVWSMN